MFSFFCCSSKYERKVNVTPWVSLTLHKTHCVHTSVLCFTSDPILVQGFTLTWKSETQSEKHQRHFDGMHSDMSECGFLFFVHCISTYWQDTASSILFYLCVPFLTNIFKTYLRTGYSTFNIRNQATFDLRDIFILHLNNYEWWKNAVQQA